MRNLKRTGRIAAMAVLCLMGVSGVLRLTGQVRYLVTNGVSMTPLYHSGDLAVITPTSRYRVGEVAAYHSVLLKTTVLHRIVGITGGHYSFKGDHNTWLDPEQPTSGQLLGTVRLHVPHGGILLMFHGLLFLVLGAGTIAVIVLAAPTKPSHLRKRLRMPGTVLHRRITVGALVVEGLLGAVLGASFAFGAAQPAATNPTPTIETSAFTYGARTTPNAVYPNGTITTGDPVFTRVVSELSITYLYQADGPQARLLDGTIQLSLVMTSSNGWHRDTLLGGPAPIAAGYGQATVALPIAAIEATLAQVRLLTGTDTGTVKVTIHAKTSLVRPGARPESIDAPLNMELTPLQLLLQSTPRDPGTGPAVITTKILNPAGPPPGTHATAFAPAARWPLAMVMVLLGAALAFHLYLRPRGVHR